ncbi:MAG: ABC transporter ATP-binding protein [Deltaproteobacteria bacterium]|nr:ABC transporter ATP-binding protein [Deltaproteobacteria bacterium]
MTGSHIIAVEKLCVIYKTYRSKRRTLRESAIRSLLRRDERVEVRALRDVSFTVRQGESLGVVGRNGAGKSTLCMVLTRIMDPTSGQVDVRGTVSALLALGAGFQVDLAGSDNILLNGAFLGLTLDQIRAKYDDIVAFSGLGDAIRQPVRTYSSGMRARLAFSIAQSIQPEVLVIDELMGVGDEDFKKKSTARMKELMASSQALIVVSHEMATIRSLCSRVVWLEQGRLVAEGPAEEIVERYCSAATAGTAGHTAGA